MVDRGLTAKAGKSGKKPYKRPELKKLETLRQLTQGGKSRGTDIGSRKASGT